MRQWIRGHCAQLLRHVTPQHYGLSGSSSRREGRRPAAGGGGVPERVGRVWDIEVLLQDA
jgi:hypothetical protein